VAEVFNIIWCDRTFRDDSTKVQRRGRTPINLVPSNKAVVLYPSLLTPEIVVGDGDIEILVALLKYAVLTREDANKHIKIYPGLEPSKVYWTASDIADEPLFQENLAEKIEVKGLTTEMSHEKILSTHRSGKFAGLIAESMVKMLKANGLTSLYSVVLSNECLKKRTKHGMALNVGINAIEPKEFQDVVLTNKVMEELHGKSMLSGGKYCFQVNASGMDLCRLNRKEPIQSYHPVFYYKTLDAPRVGFVSDVPTAVNGEEQGQGCRVPR
jgi:hypothetical protein